MSAVIKSPSDVATARRSLRELCASHVVAGQHCQDAQLALSEMLGNALLHARPPVHYDVQVTAAGIRLTVDDAGSGDLPRQRGRSQAPSWAEHGRGLMIMEELAQCWGCEKLPHGGLRVWAVV